VVSLDALDVLLPGAEPLPGFGGVLVVGRQQVDAVEDEGRGDVFAGALCVNIQSNSS